MFIWPIKTEYILVNKIKRFAIWLKNTKLLKKNKIVKNSAVVNETKTKTSKNSQKTP